MARIFLAAQASVGHTNALRAIGRVLLAEGHAVALAIPELHAFPFAPEQVRVGAAIVPAARAEGIEVFGLKSALSGIWHALRVSSTTGYDEMAHAVGLFMAGLAPQSRAVAEAARTWKADVIVSDYLFFAGWFAARLTALPFVALYHSALPFPSAQNPPFGSGLPVGAPKDAAWETAQRRLDAVAASADARLARAAKALGVDPPPPNFLNRPYSDHLNLLTTVPELEPGLAPLTGPVVFAGPCVAGRTEGTANDPALKVLRDGVRRVYVSLGTVFNSKPEVFASILRGLDDPGLQVVVSAGASTERLKARPPSTNSHIFARVPQVALLDRVDAVVTHGGNNTTQETLAAGKPMLVMPFGGDQLENARRIERLSAGIALLPGQLSDRAVREAMARLLGEPGFTAAAARARKALGGVDGTRRSVDAILKLVEKKP